MYLNRLAAAIAVMLVLAACGAAGTPSASTPDEPHTDLPDVDGTLTIADAPADAVTLQIADALAAGPGAAIVGGSLFVQPDGTVLLCSAIAESFPPQCGGERLRVVGLDLATIDALQEASGVRWAEAVELRGIVEAG